MRMREGWRSKLSQHVPQATRYTAASGIGLLVDCAAYLLLLGWTALAVPLAAAAAYGAGLFASYWLITHFVFKDGWLRGHRILEAALFVLSGGLGMVLTYVTSALYLMILGSSALLAKLAAILVSFTVVYLCRAAFIFRR